MQLKIGGIDFEIDPHQNFIFDLEVEPQTKEAQTGIAYTWDCSTSKGQVKAKLNKDGEMVINPFLGFLELNQKTFEKDKLPTLQMKLKVMAALGVNNTRALERSLSRKMGAQKIKLDLAHFEALKPYCAFRVWYKVEFLFFQFSNSAKGLNFYLAIPHRLKLETDIYGVCKSEELAEGLKGRLKVDDVDYGVALGGTKTGLHLRLAHLRQRYNRLLFGTDGLALFDPYREEKLKKLKEEMDKLAKQIEESK